MAYQKCIIFLEDGTRLEYTGPVQYDVVKRPRVKKGVQFSVPIEDDEDEMLPEDDVVSNLRNMFGMR